MGVNSRHDALDGAVLAGCIHGLKDEQHRPAVLCVEHILQFGQRLDPRRERFLGTRFILGPEVKRVTGIDMFQAEARTVGDLEGFREAASPLDDLFLFTVMTSIEIDLPPRDQRLPLDSASTASLIDTALMLSP